jgi:hypothetical protein
MLSDGREHAVVNRCWHNDADLPVWVLPSVRCDSAAGVGRRAAESSAIDQGEGTERRYFYGSVWAVTLAQAVLLVLWKTLPKTHTTDLAKLAVYVLVLAAVGLAAVFGLLPRTRSILPGEIMVAD